MADKLDKTVRILRRSKVATDDRGHTVWVDPVESAELELVTTRMLKRMLASDDEAQRQQIHEAAQGKDGLLARDTQNESFEIIDDEDLKAALDASVGSTPPARAADVTYEVISEQSAAGDEELSLVSTQALRRILDGKPEQPDEDTIVDDDGGFDPYNSA